VEKDNKKLKKIFKDPEYAGVDDIDLVHYLNEKLKENPRFEVPETYAV